jgi:hypothetical protein
MHTPSDHVRNWMSTSSNVKSLNRLNLNVRPGARILLQIKIPCTAMARIIAASKKNLKDARPNVGSCNEDDIPNVGVK